MNAEILAIGSEMLRIGRRDTNGDWLVQQLNGAGVEVISRTIVDDDVDRIAAQLRIAASRAQIVVVTGGLGPTSDDRTRQAFSKAFALELVPEATMERRLQLWFESRGRAYSELQRCQALRPTGATWIENPVGTAPGFQLRHLGCVLVALPGVPAEMKAMFDIETFVDSSRATLANRRIRTVGRTESSVEQQLSDLYGNEGIDVTILSGIDGVELHLRAKGDADSDPRGRVARVAAQMSDRLGRDAYGDGELSLAQVVGRQLAGSSSTLATAESCTAGLIAARVTELPGSSGWFRGGWVVYSNDLKIRLAGISPKLLEQRGAVCEEVAVQLAEAVRDRCGATYGIGVTGVAGPGGGTPEKPIGLVHVALASASRTEHWERRVVGDRAGIRGRTAVFALDRLRRRLLDDCLTEC